MSLWICEIFLGPSSCAGREPGWGRREQRRGPSRRASRPVSCAAAARRPPALPSRAHLAPQHPVVPAQLLEVKQHEAVPRVQRLVDSQPVDALEVHLQAQGRAKRQAQQSQALGRAGPDDRKGRARRPSQRRRAGQQELPNPKPLSSKQGRHCNACSPPGAGRGASPPSECAWGRSRCRQHA